MLWCSLQADDQSISVTTQLVCGFLGYHHEELQYWLSVVSRMKRDEGNVGNDVPYNVPVESQSSVGTKRWVIPLENTAEPFCLELW